MKLKFFLVLCGGLCERVDERWKKEVGQRDSGDVGGIYTVPRGPGKPEIRRGKSRCLSAGGSGSGSGRWKHPKWGDLRNLSP